MELITFECIDISKNNTQLISLNSFFNKTEKPEFTDWTFKILNNYINEVLEVAKKLFNFNYKDLTIAKNSRLKRAYARCWYTKNHIEFSNFLLEDYVDDFVKSTIIHEMCHALSYQFDGKKFKIDHNHDATFKRMCRALCEELGVPDGSKASENGETRQEAIEKYNHQEKNNKLITVGKFVETIIDIVIKNTVNVFIKTIDVDTLFLICTTLSPYNDS